MWGSKVESDFSDSDKKQKKLKTHERIPQNSDL